MRLFRKYALGACAVLIGAAFCGDTARASDLIGVYAMIDHVVFEPNVDAPERVQIVGIFAMADRNNGSTYQAPIRGYLYFTLPTGKETVARKEWADLKEMAGKKQVVAFTSRWASHARLRKSDEKLASPDAYEPSVGVVKVRTDTEYAPVKSLLEFAKQ